MVRQRILNTGVLLLACVLMYLICGGFPPLAWRGLFILLLSFHPRYEAQGWIFLFHLLLVLIQALLVCASWILLAFLFVREGKDLFFHLYHGYSQGKSSPSRVFATSLATAGSRPSSSSGMNGGSRKVPLTKDLSPSLFDGQLDTTSLPPASEQLTPSTLEWEGEALKLHVQDLLKNPFEDDVATQEQVPLAEEKEESSAWSWFEENLFEERESYAQSEHTSTPGEVAFDEQDFAHVKKLSLLPEELPQPDEKLELSESTSSDSMPAPGEVTGDNRLMVSAISHPGIKRAQKPNEDSYLELTATRELPFGANCHTGLFLVADGMGGSTHGQYASSSIVQMIRADLEPLLMDIQVQSEALKDQLVRSIEHANEHLYQENTRDKVFRGTTITGVILIEQETTSPFAIEPTTFLAHIINVGDSRTYLYASSGGLRRVTNDHSMVEVLVNSGEITEEERYSDKRRNQIYRCLGENMAIEVDVFTCELEIGDQLLLCSDGLWEMVRDQQIAAILGDTNIHPEVMTKQLLEAAMTGGGNDNITAIIVQL